MRTLVLLKPDAVEAKLVGQLISCFEQYSELVDFRVVCMHAELCRKHYHDHVTKDFYPKLEEFMTSGPLVAILIDGDVAFIRALAKSLRTTYHPDYNGGPRNLIHASDSEEAAVREVTLWFGDFPEIV